MDGESGVDAEGDEVTGERGESEERGEDGADEMKCIYNNLNPWLLTLQCLLVTLLT